MAGAVSVRQHTLMSGNTANERLTVAERLYIVNKCYSLNVDRALKRILSAAKRPEQLLYEYEGGGLVLKADAVSFELLRFVISHYYLEYPNEHGTMKTTTSTDKSGKNLTQETYKVTENSSLFYTLNVYVTSSRFLVNEKNLQRFRKEDIGNIHKLVKDICAENNVNVDSLNKQLTETLSAINNIKCREQKDQKQSDTDECYKERTTCPKCNRPCRTRNILCDKGNHWIHYKCEQLTNERINELEKNEKASVYICSRCSKNKLRQLTIPKPKNTHINDTEDDYVLIENNDTRTDQSDSVQVIENHKKEKQKSIDPSMKKHTCTDQTTQNEQIKKDDNKHQNLQTEGKKLAELREREQKCKKMKKS